ncbi:MAG: hypothetical protein WA323_12150 [Candidatus Nitrosopolaris sp.]
MNRKTILAFSIVSTVALVLLIAFAPMVETQQAHAFWGGYYGGGWPDYYGSSWGWHHGGWGWHHGWGW